MTKTPRKAASRPAKARKAARTAQSSTERVQTLRERRAALGLVRVDLYVHADDADKVRAYAAGLNAGRGVV